PRTRTARDDLCPPAPCSDFPSRTPSLRWVEDYHDISRAVRAHRPRGVGGAAAALAWREDPAFPRAPHIHLPGGSRQDAHGASIVPTSRVEGAGSWGCGWRRATRGGAQRNLGSPWWR